jgi:hypothetical protein
MHNDPRRGLLLIPDPYFLIPIGVPLPPYIYFHLSHLQNT